LLDFIPIRAITFDCYGTLVDWETGLLSALRKILAAHHLTEKEVSDAVLLEWYGELEAQAEAGEFHLYRAVLASVVRGIGGRLGFIPSPQEEASLAESIRDWKPFPDTVAALKSLSRRYRLAIISNIDDDLFATTAPKFEITFDQVVTAEQAKGYKPALRNFQLMLGRLGLEPTQVLHAGQSIYHDVLPAQALGMQTVWVNRPSRRQGVGAVKPAAGKPDLEVSSIAELATAAG
jgi:2-haloacid dehalogenase